MTPDDDEHMLKQLHTQDRRRKLAGKGGLLGMLLTGGTLGLLFVLPVVAGAYLGRWLDEMAHGYSVRWTVNLLLLGLCAGAFNVYAFLREHLK